MKVRLLFVFSSVFFLILPIVSAQSGVTGEVVEYKDGDVTLEGFLAYDTSIKGKMPGVIIVHEWTGPGLYVQRRARELARLGYAAFAADIYGKGIRPKDKQESAAQAGIYRKDRALMRRRIQAALDFFKKSLLVDNRRIAAIGYCFGGGVVLELARSGADIKGVVSFHGSLNTSTPDDAKNIRAKVLVLHGADDPNVDAAEVADFQNEMRNAKVDWQFISYGGAVHSFTNPDSGNDPALGAAYNEKADRRSWQAMLYLFDEIFHK